MDRRFIERLDRLRQSFADQLEPVRTRMAAIRRADPFLKGGTLLILSLALGLYIESLAESRGVENWKRSTPPSLEWREVILNRAGFRESGSDPKRQLPSDRLRAQAFRKLAALIHTPGQAFLSTDRSLLLWVDAAGRLDGLKVYRRGDALEKNPSTPGPWLSLGENAWDSLLALGTLPQLPASTPVRRQAEKGPKDPRRIDF